MKSNMKLLRLLFLPALILILTNCQTETTTQLPGSGIVAEDFDRHLSTLSSDEFAGRGPFQIGEEKTLAYLENAFKEAGTQPGNNGSWYQAVPMVEISTSVPATMTVSAGDETIELEYRTDFVAFSQHLTDEISLESSEIVFAGYGVVAPEYDWNDYEGLDVEGKTVMVLVNDPGFGSGDSTLFKGDAMTYYGRWTYKYEEAARQGAAGVLVIHSTIPAGYPWGVVRNSWNGTGLYLRSDDGNMSRCKLEGWITMDIAEQIMGTLGEEGLGFRTKARSKDFQAIPTGVTLDQVMTNTWKEDVSQNVVAMVEGSERPDEFIIYSAHWDHLGIGVPNDGDSIYNGALDNASGISALLEIAEEFAIMEPAPERTVVFLAVTAEEQGLLGSAYYAANPIFPPERTVANINMDGFYYAGRLKDLTIVGYGQSELEEYAQKAAKKQDRYILPDQEASKGYFFRSDHFNFAKIGIPALYANGDYEHREKGVEFMTSVKQDYNVSRYHLPADEYDPETWDLSGIVEDARLMFDVGVMLSNTDDWPERYPTSEFKSIRDAYME